jgi:hypothetical protein
MSDTADPQPEQPEQQQQIPQDRVSLLQSDGNVFPYIPPQLARERAEGRLAKALGRLDDLELLVEFYSGEMTRLAQENQQLRAMVGQALPPGVVSTDAQQDVSMIETPVDPPAPPAVEETPKPTRRTTPPKKRGGGTQG